MSAPAHIATFGKLIANKFIPIQFIFHVSADEIRSGVSLNGFTTFSFPISNLNISHLHRYLFSQQQQYQNYF